MRTTVLFLSLAILLAGCDQNATRVGGNERLEDAPPIKVDPNDRPLAGVAPPLSDEAMPPGMEGRIPPFHKVFFMHQFIEALYSVPKNKMPNPNWQSPLKDTENGRVWCTSGFSRDLGARKKPVGARHAGDRRFKSWRCQKIAVRPQLFLCRSPPCGRPMFGVHAWPPSNDIPYRRQDLPVIRQKIASHLKPHPSTTSPGAHSSGVSGSAHRDSRTTH
jgi:hypothetical protein